MAIAAETVKAATQGQILDLAATLITGLPEGLTHNDAQKLIGMKKNLLDKVKPALAKILEELLVSSEKQTVVELPTKFTIDDRTYEILPFLEGTETSVNGHVMRNRGARLNASMGKEDGEFLLRNQHKIPAILCGKICFVFPDWRRPRGGATFLRWRGVRWVRYWGWLGGDGWRGYGRLVRRESPSV